MKGPLASSNLRGKGGRDPETHRRERPLVAYVGKGLGRITQSFRRARRTVHGWKTVNDPGVERGEGKIVRNQEKGGGSNLEKKQVKWLE